MRKNLGSEAEKFAKVENWGKFVKVENWGEQLSESSSFVSIKPRWVDGVEPQIGSCAIFFATLISSSEGS